MIAIANWEELLALDERMDTPIYMEMKRYFKELITEMFDEPEYKTYDLTDFGKVSVLEDCDDIENLPEIGMTEDTMTMLESIPEYIEVVTLEGHRWYRCVIIFGADSGVVIYVPEELKQGQLANWIDTWKEES